MEMNDETKVVIERRLTAAVREADQAFTTSGGSSRHWVHECFLPSLEKARLAIVDALVPTHLEGYRRDCDSLAKKLDTAEARVAELAKQVDAWRVSSKAVVDESTALWARVAELERERGRLSNDAQQGLANERALHDALLWAHEWHLRELPSPSRVTQAAIERVEQLRVRVAELKALAWPGEHRHPDQSYKAMHEELVTSLRRAEAQVAAARAMCEEIRFGEFASYYGRSHAAADVLRAMDEAAK